MLVLLSVIYMACSAPLVLLAPVRAIVSDFNSWGRYANLFFALHDVSIRVFATINSAINFYVYYWRSTRFKTELHAMLGRKTTNASGKHPAKKSDPHLDN
nr:hypothetical protein BaRGS_008614 [Batillaria attramentaria]